MSLTLEHLWPLAMIVPLIALMLLWKRRTIFALLAGIFLILAVMQLALHWTTQPERVVMLLDLSALSRGSGLRDPQYVRELAQRSLPPHTRITVVGFAESQKVLLEDVTADDAAHWPTAWPMVASDHPVNREAALAWRLSDPNVPRWLITTTSALPVNDKNLAVTRIENPHEDWAITDVQPRPNGTLLVHVTNVVPQRAALPIPHVLKLSANGVELAQTPMNAQPGEQWIALTAPKIVAPTLYKVEISPQTDLWPENDAASIYLTPPDHSTLLTLRDGTLPTDAQQLVQAGVQTVVVPRDLKIPEPSRDALMSFVEDAGGAIFLPGNNPALEKFSPLSPENPQRPPMHIVFLLDASGSMNELAGLGGEPKMRVAGRAIAAAVEKFFARDRIGVYLFNDATSLFMEGNAENLRRAMASCLPTATGSSAFDSALPVVDPVLRNAKLKTIFILLTDGDLPKVDVEAWQTVTKDVPFLIVAPKIVSEPFRQLEGNAKVASTDDPAEWESLLRELVSEQFAAKRRMDPLHWQSSDRGGSGDSVDWEELYPTENAELMADGRDAKGATWAAGAVVHRGLGRVGATNFEPPQNFAEEMLKQITPPAFDPRYTLRMEGGRSVVEAFDPISHQLLDHEQLTLRVLRNAATEDVELVQIGPGRYEAVIAAEGAFSAVLVGEQKDAEKRVLARISPAQVAGDDFPASAVGQNPVSEPDITTALVQTHTLKLSMWCYFASVLLILLHLWRNVKMGKM